MCARALGRICETFMHSLQLCPGSSFAAAFKAFVIAVHVIVLERRVIFLAYRTPDCSSNRHVPVHMCLRIVKICRRAFEPFGGLKSTVIGARDGAPANKEIDVSSKTDDAEEEASPTAETAYLGDLHLAYICFDILYNQKEV